VCANARSRSPARHTDSSSPATLVIQNNTICPSTLTVTRGTSKPAASLLPAQNGIDIVGRVVAPSGLTSVSVNDQAVTADAAGTFTTHLAVGSDGGAAVRVAALDRRGEKAVLDFVLLPAPSGSSGASAMPTQVASALPRGVQLGRYYAQHYKQLAVDVTPRVDFRCVRFPGLISAVTVPAGGTSDYAPEMIHCAAKGERYACFVRPDTRIPFMAMPDAIDALMQLAATPRERLSRFAYNVAAFSPDAQSIRDVVAGAFPKAEIVWAVDKKRQAIVDSWPAEVDDRAARRDWGFAPRYDFTRAFDDYLIPHIRERYAA